MFSKSDARMVKTKSVLYLLCGCLSCHFSVRAIGNQKSDTQAQYVMQIDHNGSKMQVLKIKWETSGFAQIEPTLGNRKTVSTNKQNFSIIECSHNFEKYDVLEYFAQGHKITFPPQVRDEHT